MKETFQILGWIEERNNIMYCMFIPVNVAIVHYTRKEGTVLRFV